MQKDTPPTSFITGSHVTLVAPMSWRFRALLVDGLVYTFLLVAAFGLRKLVSSTAAGALTLAAGLISALIYEPITVWRLGGTLGHSINNLQVVSARDGSRLSLVAAIIRFAFKVLLGWLSTILMLSRNHSRALHDLWANSSVRIDDPYRVQSRTRHHPWQ